MNSLINMKTSQEASEEPSALIDENAEKRKEQRRVYKNILSMSFSLMLIFMAYLSLKNLQSSLNIDDGIGITSLSIIYGAIIISCLFFTPLTMRILGCKWTLVVCSFGYLGYAGANFYPTWYTMIPSSIILGFAAGPLWSAKCSYLTSSAIYYSKATQQPVETIVTRFFGIFYLLFRLGSLIGNIILSLVLKPSQPDYGNQTTTSMLLCGARDCPAFASTAANSTLLTQVADHQSVFQLMGIFVAATIAATLPLIFVVDKITIPSSKDRQREVWSEITATIKLMKDLRMLLLIPLLIYSGFIAGFTNADLTKSYITCPFGISHVGYVLIAYAMTSAITSAIMDRVVTLIGRKLLVFSAGFVNLVILVILLRWNPGSSTLWVIYAIATVLGYCGTVWITGMTAYVGILFPKNQEAAFSNLRIWQSFGFLLSFAFGNFLCVNVKIYILIALMILSITLYYITEKIHDKMIQETKTPANEANLLPSTETPA